MINPIVAILSLFGIDAPKPAKEKIRIRLDSDGHATLFYIPPGYDDPSSRQMIETLKFKYVYRYGEPKGYIGGLGQPWI